MIINASRNPAATAENSIEVPPKNPYHAPAGTFHATVREVIKLGFGRAMVRFTFDLQAPHSSTPFRANLELAENMNSGSPLWQVLYTLVGSRAVKKCEGGKFDLNTLIGQPCVIETGHIYNDESEHEFPFVVVRSVQEPNTLICESGNCKASIKE